MENKITVKDLARLCGVSIGTVDRAINNRGGISDKTKRLILETADKYGYVKNENALALASGQSRLIGVIIFNLYSEYFSILLTSIENSARRLGYTPVIMLSGIDAPTELDCAAKLTAMNVCGIITCSCLPQPSVYTELVARGVPVAAVANRIDADIPYIGIDNRAAMRDSAAYVLSKGYEHIIYVAPVLEKREKENIGAQGERYDGFLDTMRAFPDVRTTIVGSRRDYMKQVYEAARDMSLRHAVICSSDSYTIQCLRMFGDRLKPHGELGLMGFDHIETLEILYPGLSTVAYPTDRIGDAAVEAVISKSERDVIFDYSIINGETI